MPFPNNNLCSHYANKIAKWYNTQVLSNYQHHFVSFVGLNILFMIFCFDRLIYQSKRIVQSLEISTFDIQGAKVLNQHEKIYLIHYHMFSPLYWSNSHQSSWRRKQSRNIEIAFKWYLTTCRHLCLIRKNGIELQCFYNH